MEIEKRNLKRGSFRDLKFGDVFLDEDNYVMMVVDRDYGLGVNEDYDGYAVDLKTGLHYGFNYDDDVLKVSAKLIVSD